MADILLGAYDPHAHVRDMKLDGVHANILYPSIGLEMFGVADTVILRDIFAAYNQWLSEFCSHYPDKLKGYRNGACWTTRLRRELPILRTASRLRFRRGHDQCVPQAGACLRSSYV